MANKVMSLHDAVEKYVCDNDVLCLGGFTTNRKPYAAVYEILRQGKTGFVGWSGPAGGDWDALIGEGRVRAYINCYTANSGYTNVARRFRAAIEKGELTYEDYSQDVLMLQLHAASLGLPYLPVRMMQGSGLVKFWGISEEKRRTMEGVDNLKCVEIENPLEPGEKLLAVPVPKLDCAIIHVQQASPDGTCIIDGSPVNMSGKNYNFVSYGVNADGVIDYAELEKQVKKVRPKLIVAGASAYPRAIDFEKIAEIAHGYGAYLMVDMAHIAGLVAGGQHQSPVPYADVVTTTTHKTLRGPRGGLILTNNPVIAKRINSAVFPGTQGGPLEHVIAAKAVCFGEALKPEFKEYARKIVENAQALAAELQARGVKLVSGGTDNHLMLIDLRDEECTGKELEARLDSVHITANKNTVPGETRSPFVTSGVRLGTPAVTTRGMGVAEMKVIADCIADCIWHYDEKKDEISDRVLKLTRDFPLYQ